MAKQTLSNDSRREEIVELIKAHDGIVKLQPSFVERFYPDMDRLGQGPLKTKGADTFIPERWIGSTVVANNPGSKKPAGLSMIDADLVKQPLSLRDAILAAPRELLGDSVYKRHGAEFRCLVKLLDPGEPIVFHMHASDAQVKRNKGRFPTEKFGKDEAYFFLDAPKGPQPYTHVGLHEGVTRKELAKAVERGREYALELSPSFYQNYGEGFFVPSSTPHRPGTALTLEIQQPSDAYTLLETHAGGKEMSPEQIHPGYSSLGEAMNLVDIETATAVGRLQDYRLLPTIRQKSSGGDIAEIFPLARCKKFGGDRLRVRVGLIYAHTDPVILWSWRGRGSVNGWEMEAGDEFFMAAGAMERGLDLVNLGDEEWELYAFYPGR